MSRSSRRSSLTSRIIDRMPVISFAVSDLQHHHQVVLGAHSQPLRFKQLPLLLDSGQPLPKFYLNPLHRREHGSNPDTTFKAVRSLGTVAGGTPSTYPRGANAGHSAHTWHSTFVDTLLSPGTVLFGKIVYSVWQRNPAISRTFEKGTAFLSTKSNCLSMTGPVARRLLAGPGVREGRDPRR